jgi:hypothetical protein
MATLVNLSADETDVILSECDNVVCLSQFSLVESYDSKFVSVDQGLAKLSNLCSFVLFTKTRKTCKTSMNICQVQLLSLFIPGSFMHFGNKYHLVQFPSLFITGYIIKKIQIFAISHPRMHFCRTEYSDKRKTTSMPIMTLLVLKHDYYREAQYKCNNHSNP